MNLTKKFSAALVVTVILGTNVFAANYVSFRGGFYFQYPDEWVQVPYLTADMFLAQRVSSVNDLRYEAVFAPKSSNPFFATDYLIVVLDSVEWMFPYMIDSVIEEMQKSFKENQEFYQIEELPSNMRSGKPEYDKASQTISVVNEILSGDKVTMRNLTAKKIYDKGVVNFYFYSPDSLFEKSRQVFDGIVNSFSLENVEAAIPKEVGQLSGQKEESINKRSMLVPIGAAVIILLVLLIRLKKAAKKKSLEEGQEN